MDFVQSNEVLFELRAPDGRAWTLRLDGTATGFPEGTVVVNRAVPLFMSLIGKTLAPNGVVWSATDPDTGREYRLHANGLFEGLGDGRLLIDNRVPASGGVHFSKCEQLIKGKHACLFDDERVVSFDLPKPA